MTISIFNSVKPIPFVHTLGNLVDFNVKFAAVRVGKRRHGFREFLGGMSLDFNSQKCPSPFEKELINLIYVDQLSFDRHFEGPRLCEGQWDSSQCDWTPWKYLSKPPLASSVG